MLVAGEGVALNIGNRRWFGCILIAIVSLLLSGCWDRRELEARHFVLAVAIDRGDQGGGVEENNAARVETFVQPHGNKRYRLSLQILDIMASENITNIPSGRTVTYVISNTGESMLEMIRDMLGQVSRELWFEHIQTIIISEAAIRQGGLQPIVDLFRRNSEMRWLIKVLITSGEARALLEYQPPSGEASGIFIAKSLQLYKKNTHVPTWRTDIGDLAQSTDNKSRVLMARIELVDDVVKLGGMALFKNGKFAGYVDEYGLQGGKFILGIEKSAIITAECAEHPGKIMAFELFQHNTKLTPHVDGENIYYNLDITMNGNLGEMQCARQHDVMEDGEIHKIEERLAEEVKRNVLYSFHVNQKLQVDAIGFGARLKAHEPLVWEKVKEHWDEEAFANVSLNVSVNVKIENIGEHK